MADEEHTNESSQREKLIEHLFVGELLKCMWQRGTRQVEVLHAEVDRGGYDLVLEYNGMSRHIQLKASHIGASTNRVNVNVNLASKPSGCVIWIWFDPSTLLLKQFLWLGDEPGKSLPDLGGAIAHHSRADHTGQKHERINIRVVAKGDFSKLPDVSTVVTKLFGHIQSSSQNYIN